MVWPGRSSSRMTGRAKPAAQDSSAESALRPKTYEVAMDAGSCSDNG